MTITSKRFIAKTELLGTTEKLKGKLSFVYFIFP